MHAVALKAAGARPPHLFHESQEDCMPSHSLYPRIVALDQEDSE